MTSVRKGQFPGMLSRDAFRRQFEHAYFDPAYDGERDAIARLEAIAWDGYCQSRKSPVMVRAGPEFRNPDYEMSVEWRATRDRLQAAQAVQANPASPSRILLVNGASRNDGTCPGEMSKSFRLTQLAREIVTAAGVEVDVLDLSALVSDYARRIFPCKACASTAMPLCHWPCSCYPNHALDQTGDWMGEIYERWVAAHGVLLVTPVYWYQVASPMKLMIDRMVCADGGNPDPSLTDGKDPAKAKALELAGWDYPKHLAGRAYGVVVHGDVAGTDSVRRALCDWLDWMGLVDAGTQAKLDRYIGYYEPYATSHDALDRDGAVQEEVRNAARALVAAVALLRQGGLQAPDAGLAAPRPK